MRLPQPQCPILIRDRSRFYWGFLSGSLMALAVYVAIFARIVERPSSDLTSALTAIEVTSPFSEMAIARAEEINGAVAAYVETCGHDLAARAWEEAGAAESRYELLSSFIAFSPETLSDYMPEDYEIVLWQDLDETTRQPKVALLAAGTMVDY